MDAHAIAVKTTVVPIFITSSWPKSCWLMCFLRCITFSITLASFLLSEMLWKKISWISWAWLSAGKPSKVRYVKKTNPASPTWLTLLDQDYGIQRGIPWQKKIHILPNISYLSITFLVPIILGKAEIFFSEVLIFEKDKNKNILLKNSHIFLNCINDINNLWTFELQWEEKNIH